MSADAVRVAEDAEVGGLLHHVVALDRDLGENGRVSYSIVDGDSQGVFRLEENTGMKHCCTICVQTSTHGDTVGGPLSEIKLWI